MTSDVQKTFFKIVQDCFFTRGEYQQLLYQALSGLPGLEIVPPSDDITTLPPAILKPQQRWTGKQVCFCLCVCLCAACVRVCVGCSVGGFLLVCVGCVSVLCVPWILFFYMFSWRFGTPLLLEMWFILRHHRQSHRNGVHVYTSW